MGRAQPDGFFQRLNDSGILRLVIGGSANSLAEAGNEITPLVLNGTTNCRRSRIASRGTVSVYYYFLYNNRPLTAKIAGVRNCCTAPDCGFLPAEGRWMVVISGNPGRYPAPL